MKGKSFFIRLTQWEHWPTILYYFPLIPFFIYRSIRAGHTVFYLATNPGILYSGNGTESKFKTLSLVPEKYRPKSTLILKEESLSFALEKFKDLNLEFPVIAKPDIGFRGYLVKKINSLEELKKYIQNIKEDIIIQEFIPYLKELGIFYYRIPDEEKGHITSITIKKFISVTGDGKSSLSELIMKDSRAFLYFDLFKIIHKGHMNKVYQKNINVVLTEIGNHSKGTQFLNGKHLINKDLIEFTDQICKQIDGWYYGRLDIKYLNFDNLIKGKDFKILEVNGIISEPTHIYDATDKNASYFKAVRTINKHWEIMGKIAVINHVKYGIQYEKVIPYIKNMFWLKAYTRKLKQLNRKEL